MPTIETIAETLEKNLPGSVLAIMDNPSPCAQRSLLLAKDKAVQTANHLRESLSFDFCSNVTGIDWMPEAIKKISPSWKIPSELEPRLAGNPEGFLEAIYHLFSIPQKNYSLTIRLRTGDRNRDTHLPSLTPVWKSAEFQEREIFDLFGILFDDHPDLRRIMMWDEFGHHPMRKDYAPPDDSIDFIPPTRRIA